MLKQIEMIPVTDSQTLKDKLEEMINDGWEIRGFVNCNSQMNRSESYAVMERGLFYTSEKNQEVEHESLLNDEPGISETPKKDISISIGGD
jgi:hypothetical protein